MISLGLFEQSFVGQVLTVKCEGEMTVEKLGDTYIMLRLSFFFLLYFEGNQMFPQLDRELHFGFNKNGSLGNDT